MNMEDINWGVPVKTVTKKQEKFETPVLSMRAITAPGIARKMTFNKASKELLGLVGRESNIKIGFSGESIFLMNTGALTENEESRNGEFLLTKDLSFSDKRVFNHIAQLLKLDINDVNHLFLESIEGKPFVQVIGVETDKVNAESSVEVEAEVEAEADMTFDEAVEKADKKIVKTPVAKPKVDVPEVKPERKPERVAYAVDDTELETPVTEVVDEDDEDIWN